MDTPRAELRELDVQELEPLTHELLQIGDLLGVAVPHDWIGPEPRSTHGPASGIAELRVLPGFHPSIDLGLDRRVSERPLAQRFPTTAELLSK
jgi:hypothetical protein